MKSGITIIKPSLLNWQYWRARFRYWRLPKKERQALEHCIKDFHQRINCRMLELATISDCVRREVPKFDEYKISKSINKLVNRHSKKKIEMGMPRDEALAIVLSVLRKLDKK